MITADQAVKIFKKKYKGYKHQKIVQVVKVEGYGYHITIRPGPYTGPMGVDFDGNFVMFDANLFDENDPFRNAPQEVIFEDLSFDSIKDSRFRENLLKRIIKKILKIFQ